MPISSGQLPPGVPFHRNSAKRLSASLLVPLTLYHFCRHFPASSLGKYPSVHTANLGAVLTLRQNIAQDGARENMVEQN
jgi:hypothetical protein